MKQIAKLQALNSLFFPRAKTMPKYTRLEMKEQIRIHVQEKEFRAFPWATFIRTYRSLLGLLFLLLTNANERITYRIMAGRTEKKLTVCVYKHKTIQQKTTCTTINKPEEGV